MNNKLTRTVKAILTGSIMLLLSSAAVNAQSSGADSIRVATTGNVAPIVTSNVNAAQGSTTFPLTATVYPLSISQNVTWSIIPGGTANATVDAAGLMTVPAATSGIVWVKAVSTAGAKSDSIRVQVYCKPA